MQSNENSGEIKLDSEEEPVNPKSEKKVNKKVVLLIIIILVIIGSGVVYFLLLNKGDNNELLTEGDVKILEDKEIKVEENKINKELDSDQDGLPNHIEEILGTNFDEIDTDGDTYSDFDEVKNGYDPLNDKKYSEEEWEDLKEEIRRRDEGLYEKIFENYDDVIQKAILVCQKIEDDEQKKLCFALTKKNPLECENQSSILKEGCYLMYAFIDNDTSLCEKSLDRGLCLATILKDDSKCESSDDKNTCYTSVASAKEDSSACQKIENDIMQNICLATINRDVKYCKKIEDEDFFKDTCFFSLAIVKNDVSICNEMELEKQNDCTAFVNKDINKINCENLFNFSFCSTIGTERMDDSYCDLIKTKSPSDSFLHKNFRDQCRLAVASQILSILK